MAWIEKKADKRYLVRWYEAGTGERASRVAHSHDAAKTLKREVERAIDLGDYQLESDRKTTLNQYADQMFSSSFDLRGSTLYGYRTRWDKHIRPTIGRKPIRDLTTVDLRAFLGKLGCEPPAKLGVYKILSKVLRSALAEHPPLITRNPLQGVPRPRVERGEIHPVTPETIAALAGAVNPRYAAAILLLGVGGLRAGEVGGLRPDDVNYLERKVSIMKAVRREGGKMVHGDVKTQTSRRTVKLPQFVIDALAGHVQNGCATATVLFTTETGGMVDANKLNKILDVGCKRLGIDPVNPHQLRHSAAASLIQAGVHAKTIQDYLGHESIRITMDTYGHLFAAVSDGVADIMDGVYAAPEQGKVVSIR